MATSVSRREFGPFGDGLFAGESIIIIKLLEAGADPKAQDNLGQTASDYAKDNTHIDGTEASAKLAEALR